MLTSLTSNVSNPASKLQSTLCSEDKEGQSEDVFINKNSLDVIPDEEMASIATDTQNEIFREADKEAKKNQVGKGVRKTQQRRYIPMILHIWKEPTMSQPRS